MYFRGIRLCSLSKYQWGVENTISYSSLKLITLTGAIITGHLKSRLAISSRLLLFNSCFAKRRMQSIRFVFKSKQSTFVMGPHVDLAQVKLPPLTYLLSCVVKSFGDQKEISYLHWRLWMDNAKTLLKPNWNVLLKKKWIYFIFFAIQTAFFDTAKSKSNFSLIHKICKWFCFKC